MIRKILVASDLTACSTPALATAIALGRQLGAEIIALHVTAPADASGHTAAAGLTSSLLEELARSERDAAHDLLRQQVADARGEGYDCAPVQTIIASGGAADQIVASARELSADVVIVGTHARKGLARVLVGSTAERVLRTAACPVLGVPMAHA